jgi:membrane-bound lytic murein transglycosylase MltF
MMQKSRAYIAIVLAVLLLIVLFFFLKPSVHKEHPPELSQTQPLPVPPQESPDDIWSHNVWLGDYTEMVGRRIIRVLIPPGKTFFFLDEGQKRGLAYDNMMAFERYVNKHLKSKYIQVKVVVIPTSRKNLIPYLQQGYGDIVAGNLTITEERQQLVDFSDPLLQDVEEIVVSSANVPLLGNLFDLSGQDVYVRKSSSYYESLQKLNSTLLSLNKKPVTLHIADEYLEDEDLLEMMNAGLIPMIVMDSHKAQFWAKIFSEIKLQSQLKLRVGGNIALAVRKQTPELLQVVNGFVKENKKGTLAGNMLFTKYLVNSNYIKNNLEDTTRIKYQQTYELFQKYGRQYDWPHLLLIALAFQESGLDQKKRSKAGAIGIMQVLPRTARDKNVAIEHIDILENNIHAGAKYLRFIKSRYFADDSMDELNSNLFAIAAYNAGPARVARLRKEAASKGLDPDVWFNNVEIVASLRIGRETVQYVGNIYKYYIVYKHILKQRQVKAKGKQTMEQQSQAL